jgi:hypothetical protein
MFSSVLTLSLVVSLSPALGPQNAKTDPDLKALASYTLTMDTLNKVERVYRDLAAAVKADPTLESKMDAMSDADDSHDSLADMARKFQAIPPLDAALRKEGMTAREYAIFNMALLQAGMAAGAQKMGAKLPDSVNPANVKFVKDHEADLQKLQQIGGGGDR